MRYAEKVDLAVDPKWGPGKLAEELFEELVVPRLREPTFVRDYPEETSPLVRAHRDQPGLTEKWDLYVLGFELGTGYSELVDPVVQRDRLVAQAQLGGQGRRRGDARWTRTSSAPWSTECRPPAASEWESTGC